MKDSDSVISCSATIAALVGVFRSLDYHQYLATASLLSQATQKLSPNLKEACSRHTVEKNWQRPTFFEINDWLKDKAEAHKNEIVLRKTENR